MVDLEDLGIVLHTDLVQEVTEVLESLGFVYGIVEVRFQRLEELFGDEFRVLQNFGFYPGSGYKVDKTAALEDCYH